MSSSSSSNSNGSSTNNLFSTTQLTNQFYGLRHGQSLANVAKIISSDPSISTVEHGLSELGREQVRTSAAQFRMDYEMTDNNQEQEGSAGEEGRPCKGVAIFTSDFTRARETAGIFTSVLTEAGVPLYSPSAIEEVRLRERFFGSWNGKGDEHYQDVWDLDRDDADHTEWGVESVNSVVSRTSQLVLDVDKLLNTDVGEDDGKVWKVIFVAHGDVLQIAQTAFQKVDGKVHRSLKHLETASLREFVLQNDVKEK